MIKAHFQRFSKFKGTKSVKSDCHKFGYLLRLSYLSINAILKTVALQHFLSNDKANGKHVGCYDFQYFHTGSTLLCQASTL